MPMPSRRFPPRILPLLLLLCACGKKHAGTTRPGSEPRQINSNTKIRLDRSHHDFGKVLHGSSPSTSFRLTNISQAILRIAAEQSSCSCAEIKHETLDASGQKVARPVYLPPKREKDGSTLVTWIEPGETLRLTVRIQSSKRDPIAREEDSETHLLFEDPDIGEVVLGYRFVIDPPILVDPAPAFRTMPISKGTSGVDAFELHPAKGKSAFQITGIDGTDKVVRLEEDVAQHLGGHRYVIRFGPFPKGDRTWMRDLWFHTDLPGDYKMHVMIGGDIVPDLEFMGGAKGQSFGRFDFAEKSESRLRLRYNGPAQNPGLEIKDLEILDPKHEDVSQFFEATVEHVGGKRWDILLRYKGGLQSRRFSGSYQLHSNVHGFEQNDIGVTGFRLDNP